LLFQKKQLTKVLRITSNKYESNRFVKPSKLNPIKVKQVEILMLEIAEASGFSSVLLSPASLLGSCSVIAKVDQNNVISATRGLELISDSTNMLAIYLANGIKNKIIDNTKNPIHLSATCRVTRGQMFKSNAFVPHFILFTIVSKLLLDLTCKFLHKCLKAFHLKY
jgi:hypothetical protein